MHAWDSRRYSAEELDAASWKHPDEGALPDGRVKDGYLARKKAIALYLQGATEQCIKAETGISLPETLRLIQDRCLAVHEDGDVWGWRALVPWKRLRPYRRKHEIIVDELGTGAVGALNAVLDEHPGLRQRFDQRIVAGEKARLLSTTRKGVKQRHWRWFLDQLRLLGYEAENKWPFNTRKMGYSSICLYVDRLLSQGANSDSGFRQP